MHQTPSWSLLGLRSSGRLHCCAVAVPLWFVGSCNEVVPWVCTWPCLGALGRVGCWAEFSRWNIQDSRNRKAFPAVVSCGSRRQSSYGTEYIEMGGTASDTGRAVMEPLARGPRTRRGLLRRGVSREA